MTAEYLSRAQEVEIREWEVPWEASRPRDPYVGPEGRVWFVGQRADYVAWLDAASGEFRRFELGEGAGPHNLIVSPAGQVWYAGNRAEHIGLLDPETAPSAARRDAQQGRHCEEALKRSHPRGFRPQEKLLGAAQRY